MCAACLWLTLSTVLFSAVFQPLVAGVEARSGRERLVTRRVGPEGAYGGGGPIGKALDGRQERAQIPNPVRQDQGGKGVKPGGRVDLPTAHWAVSAAPATLFWV